MHKLTVSRGLPRNAGLLFWNDLHELSNQWHLGLKILPHEPKASVGRKKLMHRKVHLHTHIVTCLITVCVVMEDEVQSTDTK